MKTQLENEFDVNDKKIVVRRDLYEDCTCCYFSEMITFSCVICNASGYKDNESRRIEDGFKPCKYHVDMDDVEEIMLNILRGLNHEH